MHVTCWLVLWFTSLFGAIKLWTAISNWWNNLQAYHDEANTQDPTAVQVIPDLSQRKLAEEEERKNVGKRTAKAKRRKEAAELKEAERQREEALRINADHHTYCKSKDLFDPNSKEHLANRKTFLDGWAATRRIFKAFDTVVPSTRNETDSTLQIHVEIGSRRQDGSRPKPIIHGFAPEVPVCEIPPPGAVVDSTDPNNVYVPEAELVRLQALADRARLRSLERPKPPRSILKKSSTNKPEDNGGRSSIEKDAPPITRSASGETLASATGPSFEMSPPQSCSSSLTTIESEIVTTPPDSLTSCKKKFKFFDDETALSHSFIIPGNECYLFHDFGKDKRFRSEFHQFVKPSTETTRSEPTSISQAASAVTEIVPTTPRLRSLSADSTTSCLSTMAIQSAEKDPYYAFDTFTELGGAVIQKKSTQTTVATQYARQIVEDRESKAFHAWYDDPIAKAKRDNCSVCCTLELVNYERCGVTNHSKCWKKWKEADRPRPEPIRQYQVFDHDDSRFRRIKKLTGRLVPDILKKKKEEPKEIPAWLMGILP